jgi:predicted nucleic acid-binding protein
MAFVIDASVTLAWFLEDERTRFTDALLTAIDSTEYWAPAIWCLEVPNALLIAQRRRRIEPARRLEAIDQAARLPIQLDLAAPDMKALSVLAERHGLSTYDAAYVELARRHGMGLITLDRGLADAAAAEGIPVQSPGRSTASQSRKRYSARAA